MSLYNKIIDLQKLNQAWERVRNNKPAAGVDNITFEQFEAQKSEELKRLQMELKNHNYQALPVKKVILYKGEKKREVALYAMRDKVVQQSVAYELNRIYDLQFSSHTYAYRSNRSALAAVNALEKQICTGKYQYILKVDISHFFDAVQWNILKSILRKTIKEEDVLHLIEENSKSVMLCEDGELLSKIQGIYQGSGISPILSNIYLKDFDNWLAAQENYYVRYSDDMVILGTTQEKLLELLKKIEIQLQVLGLKINTEKTRCVSLEEGVDFLGYHFSEKGKTIPQKAKQNLQERLELMWLGSTECTIEEKLKKSLEIIGGWEQYFREERKISSVFEYVALVYAAQERLEYQEELIYQRSLVTNIYKDIALYLAEIWKRQNNEKMELLEYEQFYQIWKESKDSREQRSEYKELLANYRKLMVNEDEDNITEIMQLYTDLQDYEKAAFWMQKKEKLANSPKYSVEPDLFVKSNMADEEFIINQGTEQRVLKVFGGREDIYSEESLGYGGKRETKLQTFPLNGQILHEHLAGEKTIGTYIQRPNGTVKYMIFDVDISKKIMYQYERDSDIYEEYMKKALHVSLDILKILKKNGMQGYIEYSGCRGYHVWLFFTEWIPVRYVHMFCDLLEQKFLTETEGISIEFFPNKTRVREGKFGQTMKLPYGLHPKTQKRSYFLNENMQRITDINVFLDSIAKISLSAVKKVLAENSGRKEELNEKVIDRNLEVFGDLPENVSEILKNCNLMCYLCQKAAKTGYLTHFERLSILYVFGHLGEEGRQFVHQVMAFTLNYKYNTTERFIQKIPSKPISCLKLREQYKQITAEFGCNCSFKRNKNCYPSPVLHAILLSNGSQEEITVPTSRTMTKENEKKVIDEINIHKKAQELASKILEMKKQKRGLDTAIMKVEKELGKIYDNIGVDCLEIEMGLLVRKKSENGYEWVIEI